LRQIHINPKLFWVSVASPNNTKVMFTFTASSGSVLPQNCAKFNMQHKN